MRAAEYLHTAHQEIRTLFDELETSSGGTAESKRGLFDAIRWEIEVHTQTEEEVLHPVVGRSVLSGAGLVAEARLEHQALRELLDEIDALDPGEDSFEFRMRVLRERIEQHLMVEENVLFPEAQRILPADSLEDMGEQMQELEATLRLEELRALEDVGARKSTPPGDRNSEEAGAGADRITFV